MDADDEVVGCEDAVERDRLVDRHRAFEAAADFRRLDLGGEDPADGPFDQPLDRLLEFVEDAQAVAASAAHGVVSPARGASNSRGDGPRRPARYRSSDHAA